MDTLSNYTDVINEESPYFVQGGSEPCNQNILEPYNTSFKLRIINFNAGASVATLFGGTANQAQPANVLVLLNNEPQSVLQLGHQQVRRDSLTNPFMIKGLRYTLGGGNFAPNPVQFQSNFNLRRVYPTGKRNEYRWQPQNYISPTNLNTLVIDAPDFGLMVDGRTSIRVPILGLSEINLMFTIKRWVEFSKQLIGDDLIETANNPRLTGNPIADMQIISYNQNKYKE